MTNPTFNEDYDLIVAPSYDPRHTPADIPSVGVFDSPTYMICINASWWSHVSGVLSRLAELDAWRSDDLEEKRDAVQSVLLIMQEIGERIECGMSQFELRQAPSNPCVLQQSMDGGLSWVDAFDYSLCASIGGGGTTTINITNAQTYIDELNVNYDIDINLIGSKLGSMDEYTDSALCHALHSLIKSALIGALERLRTGNRQDLIIQAVAGGIAVGSAFIFGTPLAGGATAIGVGVGLILSALADSYSESELEVVIASDSLIKELVCCAYESIAGTKPTEASFEAMLDGCSDLSAQVSNILPLVQAVLEDRDVFLTFLEMANQAYDYAERGILGDDCKDSCNEWCHTWLDGKGIDSYIAIRDPGGSANPCTYDPVEDRYVGDKWASGSTGQVTLDINAQVDGMLIKTVYKNTQNSGLDGMRLINDGVLVTFDEIVSVGEHTKETNVGGFYAGTIIIIFQSAGTSAGDESYAYLERLSIFGVGDNPFVTDNCEAE